MGRVKDAEVAYRKALELNPQLNSGHYHLGHIYLAQSNLQSALAEMRREADPFHQQIGLAFVYSAARNKKEADAALADFIEQYQSDSAYQIAEIYAYRGEVDKAFEWLERAYKQRDGGLAEMKANPLFRNIERDPRFNAFLKKMKLPLT